MEKSEDGSRGQLSTFVAGKKMGRLREVTCVTGKGQIILNMLFLEKALKSVASIMEEEEKKIQRYSEKGRRNYELGVQLQWRNGLIFFRRLAGQEEKITTVHWQSWLCFGISLRDTGS